MPQSFVQLYTHLIYSTKDRTSLISTNIREELFSYLAGTIKNIGGIPLLVGGVSDHIHILYLQPKNQTIPQQVEEIKKQSSKWMKTKGLEYSNFYWQRGYGAFSVSPSKLEVTKNYISQQEQHHKKISFKEEYLQFLKEYHIEYDERYLWD